MAWVDLRIKFNDPNYYRKLGKKGGPARAQTADYVAMGKKGCGRTKSNQPAGFFSEIGRQGGLAGKGKLGRPAKKK